jgi:hypothetical protein
MEDNREIPQNGTWIQEVAYLLNRLNALIYSGQTEEQITTVTVTDLITLPAKEITVVDYTNPFPNTPPIIRVQHKFVTPPPIIKKITINQAYGYCCGAPSGDGNYYDCTQCVDAWMLAHPDVAPKRNVCGCRVTRTPVYNKMSPQSCKRRR